MQTREETKSGGDRTQVEQNYINGLWVPSYYGNKFTVAQRQFGGSEGEQSLDFKVATLAEAQAEADRRNVIDFIADAAQAVEEIGEDELERFAAQTKGA